MRVDYVPNTIRERGDAVIKSRFRFLRHIVPPF